MRDRAARSLILLLDENLSGRRIIEGLVKIHIPVKAQTDIMQRGLSDEEVLRILARYPDYFLLTKDSDFHKKPVVKTALIGHNIGAFVITSHKGKTAAELVELIAKAWPRIQRTVQNRDRPFVVKILAEGRIEEVR